MKRLCEKAYFLEQFSSESLLNDSCETLVDELMTETKRQRVGGKKSFSFSGNVLRARIRKQIDSIIRKVIFITISSELFNYFKPNKYDKSPTLLIGLILSEALQDRVNVFEAFGDLSFGLCSGEDDFAIHEDEENDSRFYHSVDQSREQLRLVR